MTLVVSLDVALKITGAGAKMDDTFTLSLSLTQLHAFLKLLLEIDTAPLMRLRVSAALLISWVLHVEAGLILYSIRLLRSGHASGLTSTITTAVLCACF